ncbi:zinc finger and SCAN domain-containing protein 2-like [Maniola jurtina]|uniref:zinc finger and SCAN domain-containing protein 2-like n=1 Tax=Maniola jurtina TaxID=191418 RepID=UPI001E685FB7|nr:zinc finger and SCAN domain-containing protein 2-like [Maniola jurtina]
MEVFLYNSTVCRLCGEENDNGNLLYSCEENNQNLSEIINSYLPLKVEDDGELPRTICPGCTIQLEATVEFLNLIINGQKIIRKLHQREREYKRSLKILNSSNAEGSEASDKVFYEVNSNDDRALCVYQAEHPASLQVAGLEKPKRKRGRPPKKPKTPEELAQEAVAKIQQTSATIPNVERKDDEDVSGKRRRKAPTRFKEAVQGKELERIFLEVGVIDGSESEHDVKPVVEPAPAANKEPEVIGHIDQSGELVLRVKNKGRGRPKGRTTQTREECAICGMEFVSRGRYMSHVAAHGPVLYRCGCGEPFPTRLTFTQHQTATQHTGRSVEPLPDTEPPQAAPQDSEIIPKVEKQQDNLPPSPKVESTQETSPPQTSTSQALPDLNAEEDEVQLAQPTDPLQIDDGEVNNDSITEVPLQKIVEVKQGKKKIKCNNCDKLFSNRQSKSLHNKAVHLGEKNYACTECDARFSYPRSLAVHRVSHRRVRPSRGFACDLCGKVLNHPSSVVYHKQAEHAEQRYVCGKCGKHFRHKQLLQRHQLVHSQLRPFHCKVCNASFKTKANLVNHQLLHTGVKKFTCEICKQKFAHKTSLTLHMRLHTGLKPFTCVTCGKSFSQKGNLSEHERIHTGEKPYQCTMCPRRFTTSSQHRLHARRHAADKAHCCLKCGKRFVSRNSWALHVRRFDCGNTRHNKRAMEKNKQSHKQVSLLVNDKNNAQHAHTVQQQIQFEPLQHKLDMDDDSEERVIYVAYDADDSQTGAFHILDPEQAVNIEESRMLSSCQLYSSAGSSLLVPRQLQPLVPQPLQQVQLQQLDMKLETEELELHIEEEEEEELSDGTSIPVTDEQGNPLHFTMQDGTKLAITSMDGKTLQVITQDGQTIPVEINGYNEEEVHITESAGAEPAVPQHEVHKAVDASTMPVTHYFTIV